MDSAKALVAEARREFHKNLAAQRVLTITGGRPSNADAASRLSIRIANGIVDCMGIRQLIKDLSVKPKGQTAGGGFETACTEFLQATFLQMQAMRPGHWYVERAKGNVWRFIQYEHLAYLHAQTDKDGKLASSIGNDYMVKPDVLVYRDPLRDEEINGGTFLVDESAGTLADIRRRYQELPLLHASVSAKWTIRSDRAQNSRTEALNLIRNRKGRLPHIVVVTGEPLVSRIASIALGTGDIDCVYHFALYELQEAVEKEGAEDSIEMLDILISGRRLKDISDLPLDLCV